MAQSDDTDELGWLEDKPKKKEKDRKPVSKKSGVSGSISNVIRRRRSLISDKTKAPEEVHSEDETTPVPDLSPEPEEVINEKPDVEGLDHTFEKIDVTDESEPDQDSQDDGGLEDDDEFEEEYEETMLISSDSDDSDDDDLLLEDEDLKDTMPLVRPDELDSEADAEEDEDADAEEDEDEQDDTLEANADDARAIEEDDEEDDFHKSDIESSRKRGDVMPVPVIKRSPGRDDPSLDTSPKINPISESLEKASEARQRAETARRDGEAVFMVDPAVDGWIEEDLTEAVAGVGGPTSATAPRKRKPNARVKRKRSFIGFISRVFFILFLLLVAAGAAVWWKRDLLIQRAESTVTEKLDAEGIYLSYGGRHYEFPRGLVLTDVTLYETGERKKPLLKVDNFAVNTDAFHLLSKRTAEGLRSVITIENAEAGLFHDGTEICTLSDFNADLFATSENVTVNRLRGMLGGLDFDVEGKVNLPEPPESPESQPNPDKASASPAAGPLLDFSPIIPVLKNLAFSTAVEGDPNPLLRARVNYDATLSDSLEVEGRFSGRDFLWKDIAVDLAGINFEYNQQTGAVNLTDSQIGYQGGLITAVLKVFPELGTIEIENFTSNANLVELASKFAPDLQQSLSAIKFLDNPTLKISGNTSAPAVLNYKDIWESQNLAVDYQHWKGLTLAIGGTDLPISAINGLIALENGRIETDELNAEILSGDLMIKGNVKPKEEGMPFGVIVNLKRLPIEKIMEMTGNNKGEVFGLLSMDYQGRGAAQEITQLRGSGNIKVENGRFYKVPVLGPIQELLSTVVPLFGNRERSALTATYNIDSGQFITPDLTLRSDGTKVKVNGMMNLQSLESKFEANANLDGPLGLATGLASQMLTVEGSGPITDPKLQLKGVPEGISNIGGDAINIIEEGAGILGNLIGGTAGENSTAPPAAPETPENSEGNNSTPPAAPVPESPAPSTPESEDPAPPAPAPALPLPEVSPPVPNQ